MSDKDAKNNVFEHFGRVQQVIEDMRMPAGTKEAPARTCKHLAEAHPDFKDGTYWIDPNMGSNKDAFEVTCKIKSMETCISSAPGKVEKSRWYEAGHLARHAWFSEDAVKGGVFTYKIDRVQMKFLRLYSAQARQTITYQCKNSVAFFDAENRSYKRAVKLMGDNDIELSADGSPRFRYHVVSDECQHRQDTWAETKLEVSTEKVERLPIVDIAPYDVGEANQEFGLEIGEVCFS